MRSFSYTAPASVAEAVDVIAEAGPGARFLNGGTNLYDLMKLGVERPSVVVDVSRLAELGAIDTSGPDHLVFGGGARMADIAADPVVRGDYPALSESLWLAASQQLRNMGTAGGNLLQRTRCAYFREVAYPCNKRAPGSGCAAIGGIDRGNAVLGTSDACTAAFAGDWPVALIAFDAAVDVVSSRGARTVAIADLYREPGQTPHLEHHLAPDELILRVRVPVTAAGRGSTYLKVRDRESYAFALASAAVGITVTDQGRVEECRIALGGVATRPWRVPAAEQVLIGQPLTPENARAAGRAALAGARAGTHNGFKIDLAERTLAEALRIAGERAAR
ncbi:xanthine dehydrogenase family protein subunit M [Micromonospora sp. WMMD1082]|uniref:FAD binding domain-containing protein n=1 Tax=Micromonospora sp. WMMD1082 TaxID=3016104 RepID=UPI002417B75D|nr:xanthine dehydrogenase family protein subunit M [Micromonospora sp. WMMD1082]MDG4798108.1 xanthine dehydrogenase family protein subunit M [Micromonospora sp. WMMD1082]